MKKTIIIILACVAFCNITYAQWKTYPASAFGGDTVGQPILNFISSQLGYCVAGRSAWSEGKPRKNAFYKTIDGAKSWTRILDGENTVMGLATFGSDTVFVSLGGYLMRSFDGMNTWDTVQYEGGYLISFPERLLYYNTTKGTYKSTNLGITLNKISDKGWNWINPQVGYRIESPQYEVIKTLDSGKSWTKCTKINATHTAVNYTYEFVSENLIFAIVGSKLYRSKDGGMSWQTLKDIGANIQNNNNGLHFINEKDGFYSVQGMLYKTNDTGNTWCQQSLSGFNAVGLSQLSFPMQFVDDSIGFWLGSGGVDGAIFYTTTNQGGPPCPSNPGNSVFKPKENVSGIKVYPNPTKAYVTLQSEEFIMQTAQLYNVAGQKVLQQNINNKEATLSLAHLPKGLYLLKVYTENGLSYNEKVLVE